MQGRQIVESPQNPDVEHPPLAAYGFAERVPDPEPQPKPYPFDRDDAPASLIGQTKTLRHQRREAKRQAKEERRVAAELEEERKRQEAQAVPQAVAPPAPPPTRLFQREGSVLVDMWWDDGWVLVLLIWAFCWPIMIPYFLFKWTYKYIYAPIDDARQTKHHQEYSTYIKEQALTAEQELVQRLRDAAPKAPPERMRATILIEDTTVNMMVELSETERAIVYEHQLDFIELENVPLYSADEIARNKYQLKKDAEAVSVRAQPALKAISEAIVNDVETLQKSERRITTIGDLLIVPYSRMFESVYAAKQHSDVLKQKHLPKLKQIIEQFADYRPAETVEF